MDDTSKTFVEHFCKNLSLSVERLRHERWHDDEVEAGKDTDEQDGVNLIDTSRTQSHFNSEPSHTSLSTWNNNMTTTMHSTISEYPTNLSLVPIHVDLALSGNLDADTVHNLTADNLTYSSFSESILPIGVSYRHDSTWSTSPNSQARTNTAFSVRRAVTETSQLTRSTACTDIHPEGSGGDSGQARSAGGEVQHSEDNNQSLRTDETSHLQAKVMVLTDVNRTLREELQVYDRLCHSFGVQVTPDDNKREEICDNETQLLQQHLAELQRLRARLEQLDTEAHSGRCT